MICSATKAEIERDLPLSHSARLAIHEANVELVEAHKNFVETLLAGGTERGVAVRWIYSLIDIEGTLSDEDFAELSALGGDDEFPGFCQRFLNGELDEHRKTVINALRELADVAVADLESLSDE